MNIKKMIEETIPQSNPDFGVVINRLEKTEKYNDRGNPLPAYEVQWTFFSKSNDFSQTRKNICSTIEDVSLVKDSIDFYIKKYV